MNFNFGDVLGRTWKIGWNHKVLWLWQMLPGLFSIFVLPFSFMGNPMFARLLPEPLNRIASETWFTVLFVALYLIMMVFVVFVGVVSQLATTYGALQVEKGAEKLAFRKMLSDSLPYFWRVLGLYAIFVGAWMMLIWFGFMAFLFVGPIAVVFISFFLFIISLIPVLLIGYSVLELAQAAIVADNMGTLKAISHGWKLFRANWLGVILLMVILYFALFTLTSIVYFPMMIPMMLFPLGMDTQGNFNDLMTVFSFVFFPLMFVLMLAVQGIVMAFFQSAWAVTYLRLNNNTNAPIIVEEKPIEAGI